MVVFIWLTISHDIVRCQPVAGIDIGIALLSAENLRSGNVCRWLMRNPEIRRAADRPLIWSTAARRRSRPPSSGLSDPRSTGPIMFSQGKPLLAAGGGQEAICTRSLPLAVLYLCDR